MAGTRCGELLGLDLYVGVVYEEEAGLGQFAAHVEQGSFVSDWSGKVLGLVI